MSHDLMIVEAVVFDADCLLKGLLKSFSAVATLVNHKSGSLKKRMVGVVAEIKM